MDDRVTWRKEVRRSAEERMDRLWAPIYDENWGASISPTHAQFMQHFLDACPPDALILDAACGTGKYWPLILASGCRVCGIDHSQEMLKRAHTKHPDVPVSKIGLQEMTQMEAYDGAICMDAMENICPEDWLPVLTNLKQALKTDGHLYFTVELADEKEVEQAYRSAQALGLPVLPGEWVLEGGYHYYPALEQVRLWIQQAGFRLIDETTGNEYQHFLVRRN